MPVSAAPHGERRTTVSREQVLGETLVALESLRDPRGGHPTDAPALSAHVDELEMCAAVLAMPVDFRELGRNGIPLLWPWPAGAYRPGRPRREEMLEAAALMLAAVERLDRRTHRRRRPALHLVDDVAAGAGEVGQNPA